MAAPTPRDAATVVIVRDAALPRGGVEVLLLQRAEGSDHNSGAWVFPGGVLDAGDRAASELALELSDAQASARLGVDRGGLAYYLAAIRECFEEAGILLAVNGQNESVSQESVAGWPTATLRRDLHQGRSTLAALCRLYSLRLVPERLHYIAHWLTPLGRAKRFDTRFFVAKAPDRQEAGHDATETRDHVWIAPADALSPNNVRRLMVPTRAVLEMMERFQDTDDLLRWAAVPRNIPLTQPRLALGAAGLESIPPGHPAYDEIGKLDPEGRCEAWCEIRVGVSMQISRHIQRVTDADGRHTYRVGSEESGWENVLPLEVRLIADDKVVIAPTLAAVPSTYMEHADWLAEPVGFLKALR
jgi:8-oxo-dGTP pyrophosphatase MutT (NUDIX family)